MKNVVTILGYLVAFVVAWHIKVAFSSDTKIAGLFKVQPAQPGYVWDVPDLTDSNLASSTMTDVPAPPASIMTEPRFFWQKTTIVWRPGMLNPPFNIIASTEKDRWHPLPGYVWDNETNGDFMAHWQPGKAHPFAKVVAAQQEGEWQPLPGYKFSNESEGSLQVVWQPGQQHPSYKAIAADQEGRWAPMPGYQFVMDGDTWTDVVWTPGLRYDQFKVISDTQADSFLPYPGYKFVNPGSGLEVVWDPGVINSEDSTLIAGTVEGNWDNRVTESYVSNEPTSSQHYANAGVGVVVAGIAEWIFGENSFSDYVKEESAKELIRGVVKDVIK